MDHADPARRVSQTYQILALCARADGHPLFYEQLARHLGKFTAWRELPHQAELHGMAPLLRHHIRQLGASIPAETARILDGLYLRQRIINQAHTQTLLQVHPLLEKAGIRALLLKGIGLAHQYYPDPALRPVSDIDLLIRWEDAPAALPLLAGAGFRADALPSPLEPIRKELTADSPPKHGISTRVEFHYPEESPRGEFNGLDESPALVNINGHLIQTPGVIPTLRYLTRHYRRHLFAAIDSKPLQLKWIADLVSLAERNAEAIDWRTLHRSAPFLIRQFEIFYSLTPPSDAIKEATPITGSVPPKGVNQYPSGWPQQPFSHWKQTGLLKFLRHTFSSPSEWWLRLYYGIDKGSVPVYGRLIHPLKILGRILRIIFRKDPR